MSALSVAFTVQSGQPRWLLMSLPFSVALLVMGRLAPTGYRLAGDGVHVERRAGSKIISYGAIRDADRLMRPVAGLSVMGSRGVFGRFGRFWNTRLGFYRLFLSNRDCVVWLATDDGWVGLSPERPDEFLARLQARLQSLTDRGQR
jgi:Bacterial PH domain